MSRRYRCRTCGHLAPIHTLDALSANWWHSVVRLIFRIHLGGVVQLKSFWNFMARQVSRTSDTTPADLRASRGALDQRWLELNRMFATNLGLRHNSRQLSVEIENAEDSVWAGFTGIACERVTRNHGGTTWVAPLCSMPSDLLAWLGWQEVWRKTAGLKTFQFRNIGLTVYIGRQNEALKPQFLRLEWPGISNWSGSDLSFQSPGAGHPHWQFDLLQSLKNSAETLVFNSEPTEIVEDFGSSDGNAANRKSCSLTFRRTYAPS